jgi:type VI protein secretion system component Hcp
MAQIRPWKSVIVALALLSIPTAARTEDLALSGSAIGISPADLPGGAGTLRIQRTADKATPKLQEAIADGKVFQNVQLTLRSSQAGVVYKLKLEKVRITSYNLNGLAESVTLSFQSVVRQ